MCSSEQKLQIKSWNKFILAQYCIRYISSICGCQLLLTLATVINKDLSSFFQGVNRENWMGVSFHPWVFNEEASFCNPSQNEALWFQRCPFVLYKHLLALIPPRKQWILISLGTESSSHLVTCRSNGLVWNSYELLLTTCLSSPNGMVFLSLQASVSFSVRKGYYCVLDSLLLE